MTDLAKSAITDQALVAAARSGSASAFALLVERYHAPLLRTLTRLTGDPELAADLTQDAFEQAFRQLDRLATAERFAPWLYAIARNRWRMAARRRRLRQFVSLDWLLVHGGTGEPALLAGDVAAGAAERDLVQRTLAGLRPQAREALLLRQVWGFTCREVATSLGITPAAARQRLARAKGEFRRRHRALAGAADEEDADDALL